MARPTVSGLASKLRAKRYVMPARSRRLLWGSLAVAGLVVCVMVGLYFAGLRRTLSPGALANHHAPLDMRCVQCHETGNNVADLRCERCHDAAGQERLSHAAHVLFGSSDRRKAERAEMTSCTTCHTDHQGRAFMMQAVDDRECASCHAFSSLGTHPEFAVVRAQITTGLGLTFPHDLHIEESRDATGLECSTCHLPTEDRRGFQPVSFDRHCASCHTENGFLTGRTDPVSADLLVLPEALPAGWRDPSQPLLGDAPRGRKLASNLRHRDAWVRYNALRLRSGIDPDGDLTERMALRSQVAYLEVQQHATPVARAPTIDLARSLTAVEQELAALDRTLALPATPGGNVRALRQLAASVQTLSRQLASADSSLAGDLQELAGRGIELKQGAAPRTEERATDVYDERRTELLALTDAIIARSEAGSRPELKQRAQALRQRIEAVAPPREDETPVDAARLQQRLAALDEVFSVLRRVPDAQGQLEAAQVDVVRALARQRVGAGVPLTEFEARRRELLQLLDAIEGRAGDAVRLRVATLRQRIAALRPGSAADEDLRRTRRQKQRLLERLRLEMDLARAGERDGPIAQDSGGDRAATEATLQRLRERLAELESAPRMNPPLDEGERTARVRTLSALLLPCLKCHELSGANLARVRAADPVLQRSIFTHAPHVTQTTCDTCHESARTSKLATDVNVPGVANCQTCHVRSQVEADCETCHVYHPPSIGGLMGAS